MSCPVAPEPVPAQVGKSESLAGDLPKALSGEVVLRGLLKPGRMD